jgi:hypothetical protein
MERPASLARRRANGLLKMRNPFPSAGPAPTRSLLTVAVAGGAGEVSGATPTPGSSTALAATSGMRNNRAIVSAP